MATISSAKAKKIGEPIKRYPKPEGWLPHFVRVDVENGSRLRNYAGDKKP